MSQPEQRYQTIREAGYEYVEFRQESGLHILREPDSGQLEAFVANRNHASWGLIYKNTHLEFVSSAV